ncbi:cytochrome-c oxidase, cbb3-type subunit III [Chelativorans sp. AA-79]|uniref:cytochrome-c oxidase, cbb3-type subunit III n=1 Tax=Chelativorans sp. AA-79 TaxID=3028735 RepID=UPI0023F6A000|nr:cytochrome-c oxidase, cbb3-type subunit III [Chelativorans sp. AA-79]WEX08614.1 cytochrome-c oxidase, cbb3-type subunit III [Chelativorans sp. AA-79]
MSIEKRDPVTGRMTTGHEWNGIEELETPIPKVVFLFLAAAVLFSVVYWLLMPAWPLGWTYSRGLLGIDQRDVVTRQVEDAAAARTVWTARIAEEDFATIAADPDLMRHVKDTGGTLFADNCAVCHGSGGTGGPGFPNLTTGSWLWGGDPETIAETVRVGINSTHDETRFSEMMAFGQMGVLNREERRSVTAYVRSLSGQEPSEADQGRLSEGEELFATNCAACHGENGAGMHEVGAPDLTDGNWIYGGDAQSIMTTIYAGRQGHMPHWQDRLSPVDIKILTLYVGMLAGDSP